MRILIVDTVYPAFLASHYGHTPNLSRESYARQWRALMDTFFGTADAYSHYLGAAGHEAHEIVLNCEPLQRAWKREHLSRRAALRRRIRRRELVLEQADWFQPDVVYVQNLSALPAAALRQLRRGRLLVGQIASELPPWEQVRPFELILTSFPHFVVRLRNSGVDSEYFKIAFDSRVLERLDASRSRSGAVFVGALKRSQHGRGNELLERAARRAPIDFYGYGVEEWSPESPIRRRYRGEAWGLDMFRVLARAKIALNRHIDVAEDFANNMRLYEATGVGAMLLTDAKRNLGELFVPGREVVTYATEEELVECVHHYLEHEEERAAIAAAGQERTLRQHTYGARMRELADILTRRLGRC